MRTEKEKMLAGENYDATSPELWERWQLAKRLQSEYNNTPMTDMDVFPVIHKERSRDPDMFSV